MQQTSQGVDMTELSIARVYDYALDIHNNFAVDREATIVRSKTLPDAQLQDAARRRQRLLFVACAIWRLPASDSPSISAWNCRRRTRANWRNAMNEPYMPDHIAAITFAEHYANVSVDPNDFITPRVLILGKGNSDSKRPARSYSEDM